jgi:hypothetical protein
MITLFASCPKAINRMAHQDALAARCYAEASLTTFPASKTQYKRAPLSDCVVSANAYPPKVVGKDSKGGGFGASSPRVLLPEWGVTLTR